MLRPVKWLALRAPALYKDTEWELPKLALRQAQRLDDYRRKVLEPSDNRALRAAATYQGDVLMVESENDKTIPHEVIQSYRNAFSKARSLTYRVITGADHGLTDPACRQAYTTLLVNWITEMVAGKRAADATSGKRLQEAMKTQAATARTG
jgi:dienelactone hydrolase